MSSFVVTATDSAAPSFAAASQQMSAVGPTPTSAVPYTATQAKHFQVNAHAAPWTPPATSGISHSQFSTPPPALSTPSFAGRSSLAAAARYTLCPTFLEHGFCEGHTCPYAHTFDDLPLPAQNNLLVMLNLNRTANVAVARAHGHQAPAGPTMSTVQLLSQLPVDGDRPGLAGSIAQDSNGPSSRRFPQCKVSASAMNSSAMSSHYDASSFSAGTNGQCPPSPESHSDISSISSASGHGGCVQQVTPPTSAPESPSSASRHDSGAGLTGVSAPPSTSTLHYGGPQPSPFIKAQMYYSQSATRVTLPERCRYPHATPGTYYDYLNVKRTASKGDIVAKYQQWRDEGFRKANAIDSEKAAAMDRLIVDAKNILSSDALRAAYDLLLPPSAPAAFQTPTATTPTKLQAAPTIGPIGIAALQPIPLPSAGDSIW